MEHLKYIDTPEAELYRLLRKDIIADLVRNDFPPSEAGSLWKHFDPADDRYLDRVDAWQRLLCRGALEPCEKALLPSSLERMRMVRITSSSILLDAPTHLIANVHQVARLLYKYDGKARKAWDIEAAKQRLSRSGHPSIPSYYKERMVAVLRELRVPSWYDIVGRFGPGACYERVDRAERWRFSTPFPQAVPPVIYDIGLIDEKYGTAFEGATWAKYGITRLQEVPKSLKTTRTVSSEPATFMYAQLGVMDHMYRELHRRFPNHISLHDQERHARKLLVRRSRVVPSFRPPQIAKAAWHSEYFAVAPDPNVSIDLSDASDYVSRSLVSQLLPEWHEVLFAVRSTFTLFPDGTLVPLRTFAPMGSGVCFPVLTAVCAAACAVVCNDSDDWGVYGDDIIVPLHAFDEVVWLLKAMGLVVNESKSCSTGRYREACGCEVYQTGDYVSDITPALIRKQPWKADGSTLEKWIHRMVDHINWDSTPRRLLELSKFCFRLRWNSDEQHQEIWVPSMKLRKKFLKPIDGREGLVRHWALNTQQDVTIRKDGTILQCRDGVVLPSSMTCRRAAWQSAANYPHLTYWVASSGGRFTA